MPAEDSEYILPYYPTHFISGITGSLSLQWFPVKDQIQFKIHYSSIRCTQLIFQFIWEQCLALDELGNFSFSHMSMVC